MNGLQQDRAEDRADGDVGFGTWNAEETCQSSLVWMARVGGRPLSNSADELLMRAVKAACAPGRYDPRAPVAPQRLASTRTAPIAAAPLSSLALPTPLAPMSDDDRSMDEAWRLPSFASPPATQSLAASPAPDAIAATSQLTDYEKGAAEARKLLGKTAGASRSSPAHPASPAPDAIAATSQLTDYEKGAAEARKLLGKTA